MMSQLRRNRKNNARRQYSTNHYVEHKREEYICPILDLIKVERKMKIPNQTIAKLFEKYTLKPSLLEKRHIKRDFFSTSFLKQ